jgi:transposase
VAGIDVSKAFSDMCILAPDNSVHSTTKIFHDLPSLERSLLFLRDAEMKFGARPVLVMEATAHYHRILQNFMLNAGYEVIVINPIQSGALKNI